MQPFTKHSGKCAPIPLANVDTDQIMPKQFLKHVGRAGFGKYLFYDWRYDENGNPKPDFVLNDPRYSQASILIAGANFGCGSSREHAPWAIEDFGFRVIIAPSFADIFYANCLKIGLLPITQPNEIVNKLLSIVSGDPDFLVTVDLESCSITAAGFNLSFTISEHHRQRLLNGLDDIAITLKNADKIASFENKREQAFPFFPKLAQL